MKPINWKGNWGFQFLFGCYFEFSILLQDDNRNSLISAFSNLYDWWGTNYLLKTESEYKYDVFISYNKVDLEFVRKLVRRIEREHIKGNLIKVFFDEWDVEPGENILLKIEDAEPSSRFILLVMSPEWFKSNWTTLERVIPVYEDPAGLKGRIIPIMRRRCEPPPSIRILKWLDFTTDSNFEREARKLVARIKGQSLRHLMGHEEDSVQPVFAIPNHEATTADLQDEELVSNLFPVIQLPSCVNVANAKIKKRADVWKMLGGGVDLPTFAIDEDEGKIYSFANLKNPQYRWGELCLEPSTEKVRTEEVLSGNNSKVIIELLNRSMTAHMTGHRQKIGMVYDWRDTKKTFFPLEKAGDQTRHAHWKVGKIEYTRFLVKKVPAANPYYVHRSCKATFTLIDGWTYLKIQPGWHFTDDGMSIPVSPRRMSSLSSRWMNKQRNHSVLDEVRFWVYILSKGSSEINLFVGGSVNALIPALPIFATVDRGIDGDYRRRLWREKPGADYFEKAFEKAANLEGDIH